MRWLDFVEKCATDGRGANKLLVGENVHVGVTVNLALLLAFFWSELDFKHSCSAIVRHALEQTALYFGSHNFSVEMTDRNFQTQMLFGTLSSWFFTIV